MITALVNDCSSHLRPMEDTRQSLEGLVAKGTCTEEELREKTLCLTKHVADYKNAAKFCKKHIVKPKEPKGKKPEEAPQPWAAWQRRFWR